MNGNNSGLIFRNALGETIKGEIATAGGAFRLAKEIERVNGARGEAFKVDRRKLTALAKLEDVKVTFYELAALDTYLSTRGRGLSTLMQKPSILKPLAFSGKIAFLLGSKPQPKPQRNTVLSRWDVLALADLQRSLDRVTDNVRFSIEDVLLRDHIDEQAGPDGHFSKDKWRGLIDDPETSALVCFGSPRASHAAEYLLSAMFCTDPFVAADPNSNNRPPFLFLWAPHVGVSSCLAAYERAPANVPTNPAAPWRYWGIDVMRDDGLRDRYRLSSSGRKWSEYGLLAVQRRRSGQIWVVIAGMTGPGTCGTARLLETLESDLPQRVRGSDSQVLWGVVEAEIEEHEGWEGDTREVVSQKLLRLDYWQPRQTTSDHDKPASSPRTSGVRTADNAVGSRRVGSRAKGSVARRPVTQHKDIAASEQPAEKIEPIRKIYTVGYGGRMPSEFVELLARNGINTIVDVRIDPTSSSMGSFKKAASPDKGIENLLQSAGIAYVSLPELGNPFRSGLDWATRYQRLLDDQGAERSAKLREVTGVICLLCAEKDPAKCHRTQVAEYMQKNWSWSFESLV